jgi:D-alanyl-D-alanine carboxypeptidase
MSKLVNFKLVLAFVSTQAFGMGSPNPASCEISKHQSAITSIMDRRVPRGSNGRGAGISVIRLSSKNELLDIGYEKNPHVFQAVASTQKIMTAWVLVKYASNLNNRERFNNDDLFYDAQGTRAFDRSTGRIINPGDSISLTNYLYTLMTQSSNGAGHAIARGTSRTVENFVNQMNNESLRLLGANRRSYFQNPSGLTDDSSAYRFASTNTRQGSTAREMALLIGIMMNDSTYKSKLASSGIAHVSSGYLYKNGFTKAAGRTAVMRFPHQGKGCSGQSIAVALFGENSSAQASNFLQAYEELKSLLR